MTLFSGKLDTGTSRFSAPAAIPDDVQSAYGNSRKTKKMRHKSPVREISYRYKTL